MEVRGQVKHLRHGHFGKITLFPLHIRKCFVHLQAETLKSEFMEERKFKNRTEQAEWVAMKKGWGPLTDEDRAAIDDAVRMVTNLDDASHYAVSN